MIFVVADDNLTILAHKQARQPVELSRGITPRPHSRYKLSTRLVDQNSRISSVAHQNESTRVHGHHLRVLELARQRTNLAKLANLLAPFVEDFHPTVSAVQNYDRVVVDGHVGWAL